MRHYKQQLLDFSLSPLTKVTLESRVWITSSAISLASLLVVLLVIQTLTSLTRFASFSRLTIFVRSQTSLFKLKAEVVFLLQIANQWSILTHSTWSSCYRLQHTFKAGPNIILCYRERHFTLFVPNNWRIRWNFLVKWIKKVFETWWNNPSK